MPIFISYSRKDADFVELFAVNLVRNRHNVWLDKWELNVGDSLIDKIQSALTESSAVILILSKHSVDSAWCRKELNSILMRELSEKKSILLPCVIDDCDIPLFVQEKLYADFRKDKDEAFSAIDKALAKISNPYQGRTETPDFHIDFATSYGDVDRRDLSPFDIANGVIVKFVEFMYVEHGEKWPYIVTCQWMVCFKLSPSDDKNIFRSEKTRQPFIREIVQLIIDNLAKWNVTVLIDSAMPVKELHRIQDRDGRVYEVELTCRRLGEDNGMITAYHAENNIKRTLQYMDSISRRP